MQDIYTKTFIQAKATPLISTFFLEEVLVFKEHLFNASI